MDCRINCLLFPLDRNNDALRMLYLALYQTEDWACFYEAPAHIANGAGVLNDVRYSVIPRSTWRAKLCRKTGSGMSGRLKSKHVYQKISSSPSIQELSVY